ncbi:hypothetical protein D3C71_1929830 [compost metagenome]
MPRIGINHAAVRLWLLGVFPGDQYPLGSHKAGGTGHQRYRLSGRRNHSAQRPVYNRLNYGGFPVGGSGHRFGFGSRVLLPCYTHHYYGVAQLVDA